MRTNIAEPRRRMAVACVAAAAFVAVAASACGTSTAPTPATPATPQMTVAADAAKVDFASADSATITPGVQTYTGDAQCTTNYVFVDKSGNVYLGQAAHCSGTGKDTETNGCQNNSLPIGTAVTFNKGGNPITGVGTQLGAGTLVYNSWLTMHQKGETDQNTCSFNDLALIKVNPDDVGKVNPSIPFWGGPTGIDTDGTTPDEKIYSYGSSSLKFGFKKLSKQHGVSKADQPADNGWSHIVEMRFPGIPGDSGSAYLDAQGRALGVLSTIGLALPPLNNIGDISHELQYARANSGIDGLQLVLGTAPFKGE
ncbi:hypothetical protein [Gordonia polyisoprenivorans]|uniref:hypothetical protein n=1 Tax=Gordonia polyisoprenivorans TaxID=84595 RepID=UPI001F0A15EC|nr:hypothetical protein [Gordonia polyisoprenivorans]